MQHGVDLEGTEADRPGADSTSPANLDQRVVESRHGPIAQLLIAWSPLSVILLAYAVAGWISAPLGTGADAATNRLGFGVHVAGPAGLGDLLAGRDVDHPRNLAKSVTVE